jgi:hypothetical protein
VGGVNTQQMAGLVEEPEAELRHLGRGGQALVEVEVEAPAPRPAR